MAPSDKISQKILPIHLNPFSSCSSPSTQEYLVFHLKLYGMEGTSNKSVQNECEKINNLKTQVNQILDDYLQFKVYKTTPSFEDAKMEAYIKQSRENQQLVAKNTQLKADNKLYKDSLRTTNYKLTSLSKMHAKALEEIHQQKIQTKDLKKDNTDLLLKLSTLEKNQKDRSSEISRLEAENKEMKGSIKYLMEANTKLYSDTKVTERECQNLSLRCEEQKSKFAKDNPKLDKDINYLSEKSQKLRKELKEANLENKKLQKNIRSLKTKQKQIEKEKDDMLCKIRSINFNKDEASNLKTSVASLKNENENLKSQLKILMNKMLSPKSLYNGQENHSAGSSCIINTPKSQDSGVCVSEKLINKGLIDDSNECTKNSDSGVCVDYNLPSDELSGTTSKSLIYTKEADNTVVSTAVENNSITGSILSNNKANPSMMVQCGKPKVQKADENSKVGYEKNNFFTFNYQDPSKKTEISENRVNNNSNESHPKIYWVDQAGKFESTQLAGCSKNKASNFNDFCPTEKTSSPFKKVTIKVMTESLQILKSNKKCEKKTLSQSKPFPKVVDHQDRAPKLSEALQSELKRRFSLSPADMVAKKSKKSRRLIKVIPKKKKKTRVTLATKIAEISMKKIPSLENNDDSVKNFDTVVVKQEPLPKTDVKLTDKNLCFATNGKSLQADFSQKVANTNSKKISPTKATEEQAFSNTCVKDNVKNIILTVDASLLKPKKAVLILKDLKCETEILERYNISQTSLKRILKHQNN